MNETQATETPATRAGWRAGYLLAAFGLYMVDQVSKAWAVKSLRPAHDVTLIKGFLDLVYTENPGIAFGQLQEGGSFGRWFFVILAIAAAIGVLYYFLRTARNDDRILGACALLLAGITGNLTDRIRFGYVIDFISAHAGSYHWPIFNVADASICVGALLLAYDLLVEGRRTRKRGNAETLRRGDTETRRHGDPETRGYGDVETRRQGEEMTRSEGEA